ncbi:MAG: hypothetical protein D084_Lepto4C00364G0001 [Leptospirillum sp. Group IV 'UBA BS']|nr:MAG: hypothetical protein D084_Lepto4C00364G0001 [Leptospirillum sp. Group IV 'UBA BS']
MAFGVNSVINLDQPVGRSEPKERSAERVAARRSEEESRREEAHSRVQEQEARREEQARSDMEKKVDFFA